MGIMMGAPGVDVLVGFLELEDFLAGETGGQAALAELVFAFDFTFGLRRGGLAQAEVVELERPTQLRERVGNLGEEEARVIAVKLEGPSVREKGGGQKIKVGKQEFTLVKLGTGEQATAIIEQEKGDFGVGEPAVG